MEIIGQNYRDDQISIFIIFIIFLFIYIIGKNEKMRNIHFFFHTRMRRKTRKIRILEFSICWVFYMENIGQTIGMTKFLFFYFFYNIYIK